MLLEGTAVLEGVGTLVGGLLVARLVSVPLVAELDELHGVQGRHAIHVGFFQPQPVLQPVDEQTSTANILQLPTWYP